MLRRLAAALCLVALGTAGCGGGGGRPITIGVLADCTGGFGSFNELELTAAELPFRTAVHPPADPSAAATVLPRSNGLNHRRVRSAETGDAQ